eukprot:Gb_22504 [translate_table: standard]
MPKPMTTHCILGFIIYTAIPSTICPFVANAQSLSFNFSSFAAGEGKIRFHGDAFVSNNGIDLTKDLVGENRQRSYGRAYYWESVPLWDKASKSIANFSTSFKFIIKDDSQSRFYGDGLAFFMQNPANANESVEPGGSLGLVNESSNGNASTQIVAVEFDTYKNDWDPDYNHVGIDVNNIISKTVVMEKSTISLNVFLSNSSTVQGDPIMSFVIDLSKFVPESIDVGFAASSGEFTGTNRVLSWNFSSVSSWSNDEFKIKKNRMRRYWTQIITILIAVIFLFTVFCVSAYIVNPCRDMRRRRRLQQNGESTDEIEIEMGESLGHAPHKFTYSDLAAATKYFSEDEKLGQGGFGGVYKGILADTREAVRGCETYLTRIKARGELLLVYEYLPNASLDKHLFEGEREPIDWKRRYTIASGLASALLYLHEEGDLRVIHRDVKSSNVMLDYNFSAKLGDFGLARLVEHELEPNTTVVAGTFGYLAPECARTRRATTESDVFSFGAVALEIASGRRVLDKRLKDYNMRLVEWVWDLYGPTIRQALKTLKFEAPLPELPPNEPVAMYGLPLQLDNSFSTTYSSYPPSPNLFSSSHMPILS